ncbi:hypothetical protein CR513_49948, partial [Mucuna pruriens]
MNTRWDTKKPKLSTYVTRSKSKAMENKIETVELQNQDLKGEILSQTNAAITAMANHSAVGHAQVDNTADPLPHAVRDLPYKMRYGWNNKDPTNEEKEQLKAEAQHQASQITQPLVVHRQTLSTKDKWQSLEEQLHAVEGGNQFGLEVMDLYLVPDVGLLTYIKTPEFGKYKGSSYPRVHLATLEWEYVKSCRDLAEAFLKQYKYNEDMASDRSQVQNMFKKE